MKKIKLNTAKLHLKKERIMELSSSQQSYIAGGTGITVTCTALDTCVGCVETDEDCGGPTAACGGGGTGATDLCQPSTPPRTGNCHIAPFTNEPTCLQVTLLDC